MPERELQRVARRRLGAVAVEAGAVAPRRQRARRSWYARSSEVTRRTSRALISRSFDAIGAAGASVSSSSAASVAGAGRAACERRPGRPRHGERAARCRRRDRGRQAARRPRERAARRHQGVAEHGPRRRRRRRRPPSLPPEQRRAGAGGRRLWAAILRVDPANRRPSCGRRHRAGPCRQTSDASSVATTKVPPVKTGVPPRSKK